MESRLAARLHRNASSRRARPSCIVEPCINLGREPPMCFRDPTPEDGAIEECLDELNECVASLARHPPTVLAVALRGHLESLLRGLLQRGLGTREGLHQILEQLVQQELR